MRQLVTCLPSHKAERWMVVLSSLSSFMQPRAPAFHMGVSTSPQLICGILHSYAQGFVSMVIKKNPSNRQSMMTIEESPLWLLAKQDVCPSGNRGRGHPCPQVSLTVGVAWLFPGYEELPSPCSRTTTLRVYPILPCGHPNGTHASSLQKLCPHPHSWLLSLLGM